MPLWLNAVVDILSGRRPVRPVNPLLVVARLLPSAREEWHISESMLSEVSCIDGEQRRVLRPVIREDAIRDAALAAILRRLWRIYRVVLVILGAGCLLLPLVPFLPQLATLPAVMVATAIVGYLALFAALSGAYFAVGTGAVIWRAFTAIALVIAAVLLLVTPVISGHLREGPWVTVRIIIGSSVLAFLAIVLSNYVLYGLRFYILFPVAYIRLRLLPSPQLVAARLFYCLWSLDHGEGWRSNPTRFSKMRDIRSAAFSLERDLPIIAWTARLSASGRAELAHRVRRAASWLTTLEFRLLGATDEETYDRICSDLSNSIVALAKGDWSPLDHVEEAPSSSMAVRAARRVTPALLLVGAAISLPFLPGVAVTRPALATIQVGLVVAGVLSLTSAETWHRESVLGAVREASKRTS